MIEGLVVDSHPPAPAIEAPKQESAQAEQSAQEPETEPAAPDPQTEQAPAQESPKVEESAPATSAQVVEQEPENEDPTPPGTNKKKTAKLKL